MAEPQTEGSGPTDVEADAASVTESDVAPGRPAAPVERRKSAKTANSQNTGSVRMKLKKVDEYEAKDAQMNAVFGMSQGGVKDTLKVNPLYDQHGTGIIEVSEREAHRARSTRSGDDRSHRLSRSNSDRSSLTRSNSDDIETKVTKIAYSKNFLLGKSLERNEEAQKHDHEKRMKTQGRVMPSRIQRDTSLCSKTTPNGTLNGYEGGEGYWSPPPEHRMRRWRLIMLLILIILILALALVLVLYFLTGSSR